MSSDVSEEHVASIFSLTYKPRKKTSSKQISVCCLLHVCSLHGLFNPDDGCGMILRNSIITQTIELFPEDVSVPVDYMSSGNTCI
jgi:hypothetical protein